jgi:hypothetical protein
MRYGVIRYGVIRRGPAFSLVVDRDFLSGRTVTTA